MTVQNPDLKSITTHTDELALLAYAIQRNGAGAVEVCNLVQPRELQNPWFGAYLGLIASRLTRNLPVDEESLLHVVMSDRMTYGDPMAFACIGDVKTGKPRTTSDLATLVDRIRHRHLLRELGYAANSLRQIADGNEATLDGATLPWDPAEAAAHVGQRLMALAAPSSASEEGELGAAAAEALAERVRLRAEGKALAVSTGHKPLDALLTGGGFKPGQLVVIGGSTGMGKTSLAIGMASDLAERGGRAAVVSLEMPQHEVAERLLARVSGADLRRIMAGDLDDDPDVANWRDYLGTFALPIWHPLERPTMAQIAAKAMAWKARGLDMLVVDHLAWVQHDPGQRELRYDLQVGAVATACKTLASALRISVLLLVQLNREGSKRTYDTRQKAKAAPVADPDEWWRGLPLPQMSDIKESSAIEQAADVVLFPVRAAEFGVKDPSAGAIILAKQRNGPTGTVPATWQGHTASYVSAEQGLL